MPSTVDLDSLARCGIVQTMIGIQKVLLQVLQMLQVLL
jgi:hypothetical protein